MTKPGAGLFFLWLLLSVASLHAAPLDLSIRGNENLGDARIRDVLVIPQNPELYSAREWEAWSEDASSVIEELYHDIGFFICRVKVNLIGREEGAEDSKPAEIELLVFEGPRFTFRHVSIDAGDAPMLLPVKSLRCEPGRDFDQDLLFKDRRDLLRAYGNAGFLHVKVGEIWRLDTTAHAVDLIYQVEAGKPLVFDTLIIQNSRENDSDQTPGLTSKSLLRSLLPLKKGDTVSLRKTSNFERKLRSTHVFNYVRLKDSLLAQDSTASALLLKTEEHIPGELEWSAFYETQFGPGFSTSWTHGNLGGRLHEGHALLSFAQKRQTLFMGYASLLFLTTPFRFDYDITSDWLQASSPTEDAPFFGGDYNVENQSRLSRAFGGHFRYVATAELRGRSIDQDTLGQLRDFNLNWLNSGFLTFLDDFLNPTRGSRHGLTWGNGGPILSSGELNVFQNRHNWLEVENAAYLPLRDWLNLAVRGDFGRFIGKADLNAERFFLGGTRNVRSHGWREVCPELDSRGECLLKGLEPAYILLSAELRLSPFPAHWGLKDNWTRNLPGIQVVPFVDYGLIWQIDEKIQASGRGRAFGLGLRYVLFSLFNLRLDYALDPYRTQSDGFWLRRWVIDLAQAF